MILFVFLPLLYFCDVSLCDERGSRVRRIVGGAPAPKPLADDPTVFANFAGRTARIQGTVDFPHYIFKGIKYAYAPTGKHRFLRPREKLLDGLVNATAFAPPCIQPLPGTNQIIGSEDCLALNVFTPELPTGTEGLPVIVWIHGGGFRYGSASQYGVQHLVGKRLVVVTIQYRLGSLGFLSSGTKHLPGNVALWDMVLAVQWVRNYIGFFGGNPYKINVMGHGTGASSALMFALSNVAKGITAGVIAMSGTAVSHWAKDETPEHTALDIAEQNGCPIMDPLTMVKCLQSLPAEHIIRGDSTVEFTKLQNKGFMGGLSGGLNSAPVTEGVNDGRSLPGLVQKDALYEMDEGKQSKIPLLTGMCRDETKRAVKGPLRKDVEKKIQTIPNFLETNFVQSLRETIPQSWQLEIKAAKKKLEQDFKKGLENLESLVGKLIPPNFTNYMKLKTGNIFEAIEKVAQAANDALFHAPAFLTVDKWSTSGAPTYLYSFEHVGKNRKGNVFLKGSPLIGNITHFEELNDTVSHGDDLAYLFDAYDVEGNPLEHDHELTEDDKKVREIFTQMIADFARYGAPKHNDKPVEPFDPKKNNFIQIKPKLTISNNFKFCEIGLWCNMPDRLQSSACEFLGALDNSFKNMKNFLNGLKSQSNLNPEKLFDHLNLMKNVSNQGINIFNQPALANLAPDKLFKELGNKWKNGLDKLAPTSNQNGGWNIFGNNQQKGVGLPNIMGNHVEKAKPIPSLLGGFDKNNKAADKQKASGSVLNPFGPKKSPFGIL
ncbi:liver carboxylesterase 1 [Diorhabda sublineata]|uniref:liver carboxylesterase 1 n=1 Tax=Diorhabda sublineata TaxID=1163346 RepID=UPI0024E09F96|nr:liver carboxylesterase 1 [Diorhabda sublineata]